VYLYFCSDRCNCWWGSWSRLWLSGVLISVLASLRLGLELCVLGLYLYSTVNGLLYSYRYSSICVCVYCKLVCLYCIHTCSGLNMSRYWGRDCGDLCSRWWSHDVFCSRSHCSKCATLRLSGRNCSKPWTCFLLTVSNSCRCCKEMKKNMLFCWQTTSSASTRKHGFFLVC